MRFHEKPSTVHQAQGPSIGMLMPRSTLRILAIIPVALTCVKRRRERASISSPPKTTVLTRKGYWSSRRYADIKCELDAG